MDSRPGITVITEFPASVVNPPEDTASPMPVILRLTFDRAIPGRCEVQSRLEQASGQHRFSGPVAPASTATAPTQSSMAARHRAAILRPLKVRFMDPQMQAHDSPPVTVIDGSITL